MNWPYLVTQGCIKPEFVPDCPDCEKYTAVVLAQKGTGIFRCNRCNATFVVITFDGEEMSVHLIEMEATGGTKKASKNAYGETVVSSSRYEPGQLVEIFDE